MTMKRRKGDWGTGARSVELSETGRRLKKGRQYITDRDRGNCQRQEEAETG